MKKNTIEFTTTSGDKYKLTRPTADQRIELYEGVDVEVKNPDQAFIYKSYLKAARLCLPKSVDVDDLPDIDIVEIGARASELATLGK